MNKSRTINTVVLARNAAAGLRRAACKDQGSLWNEVEADVEGASTRAAEHRAAEPAFRVCDDCPMIAACERWAGMDRYTGVAAGQVWRNGKARVLHPRLEAQLAS